MDYCNRIDCPLFLLDVNQCVPGEGACSSPWMIVGEAPGKDEVEQGSPFVGQSGQELDQLLKLIGIPRERWYVTNTIKCRPPKNRDPLPEEIACCSDYLEVELVIQQPRVIAAVGRFAARYFLGEEVDMEMVHGIPYQIPERDGLIVVPCYHPALGLRDTSQMTFIRQDFEMVGRVIRGEALNRIRISGSQTRNQFQYTLVESPNDILNILIPLCFSPKKIAVDTESANGKPWCVTFCLENGPKQGYMVMADNQPCLKILGDYLGDPDRSVITILHNALWDLGVLREIGIRPRIVKDTMIMAYLLQDKPMGLKPLGYRLLNVAMTAYNEVIEEAQTQKSLEYLKLVAERKWPNPEPVFEWVKGQPHIKQPKNISGKVISILKKFDKDPSIDLAKKWEVIEGKTEVEEALGVMPIASLSDIPFERANEYACRDAIVTMGIYPLLMAEIKERGLSEVLDRDIAALSMIDAMQKNGIMADTQHLSSLTQYFEDRMMETQAEIGEHYHKATGENRVINPRSPKQIAEVLYTMKIFRTPTQSTSQEALDKIRHRHPIVNSITTFRQLGKLQGTYTTPLVEMVDKDSRIHTRLSCTRTATGRLSSSEPNIQNIPIGTEEGRKIRQGFIASPGCVLLSNDYSQIELRVLAHVSQDPMMLRIFHEGGDIHTITASKMFEIPLDKVDKDAHRRPAKSINFGIVYGLSAIGLQKQLLEQGIRKTVDQCQAYIKTWLKVYARVQDYLDETKAFARRHGYVETVFGRQRLIPEVNSCHERIREAGLRKAINAPIQGGAADIIKIAMGRDLQEICQDFSDQGHVCKSLIQIHDDLLFEVGEEIMEVVAPLVKGIMENAVRLSIPTPVDQKWGRNWKEMGRLR